jgi:hypothetical protein
MPPLIKVVDFAKDIGVARGSIYKAATKGKLQINNGRIDLTAKKTIAYIQSFRERKREAISSPAENDTSSNQLAIEKKGLLFRQNREKDLNYEKARNKLLERKDVQMVFSKLYSIQVSKLHGLSHLVIPEIAVAFKNTNSEMMLKATDAIDGAIFSALEEIKKTMNDFLLSVKAGEVDDG